MRRAWLALVTALAAMIGQAGAGDLTYKLVDFADLQGWAEDDHEAALSTFLETCGDLRDPEWAAVCNMAKQRPRARTFFELFFRPVMIEDGEPMLFTGYFEPELRGARYRGGPYQYPIYRLPPDIVAGTPWYSRAEIETQAVLENRGLEIAWLDDPVDAFFLQIQGSGRVRLADGNAIRLGYAGKNGHEYRSIGKELVRRGIYEPHQVSAQVIRNWVRRNPEEGAELLRHNPSFVFFRVLRDLPPDRGPLGAMNRSLTTLRSIAVDPAITPLGAPVWIEKGGRSPLRRLMVAQDTGAAINGAQRADIFFGTGDAAGRAAGRIRDGGRMVVLLPIQRAFELAPGV
jgi:membrane-bound lytic murein transglycosylase A